MNPNIIAVFKELKDNPEFCQGIIKSEFDLNDTQKDKLKKYINDFETGTYDTKKAKGDFLEKLAFFIFSIPTGFFNIKTNVRNTSNEIDLLVFLEERATLFRLDFLSGLKSPEIMIECKNYNKTIDVTWVGKFAHLIHNHNVSLGIIFSKKPLTGLKKGKLTWNYATGQTKKNFLKNDKIIINITLNDLKEIHRGKNTLELIQEKILEVKFDTEIFLIAE